MRVFIFGTIIFMISFFIYIYPLNVLAHLLFNVKIFETLVIIPTAIIASAIFVYFRTNAKSFLLSRPIYYGMGLGFIGFCVFNIGLLVSLALPKITFEIGLICLFASVIICIKSGLNGQKIYLKKVRITSLKVKNCYNLVFISDVHLGSNY